MVTRLHIRKIMLLMDLTGAVCCGLLLPFHKATSPTNWQYSAEEPNLSHFTTALHTAAEHNNPAGSSDLSMPALLQLSCRPCQGLSGGRRCSLFPLNSMDTAQHVWQHRKCTGGLKVTTGRSAGSYIAFNKTAEVNLKAAFCSGRGI